MLPDALSDEALSQLAVDAQTTLGKLEPARGEVLGRVQRFGELYEALLEKPAGPALLYQPYGAAEAGCCLIKDSLTVGRLSRSKKRPEGSDITFPDSEMSRTHFQITASGGLFILRDLQSRNGTHVNGQPLGDGEETLKGGDLILAGNTIFVFTGA